MPPKAGIGSRMVCLGIKPVTGVEELQEGREEVWLREQRSRRLFFPARCTVCSSKEWPATDDIGISERPGMGHTGAANPRREARQAERDRLVPDGPGPWRGAAAKGTVQGRVSGP